MSELDINEALDSLKPESGDKLVFIGAQTVDDIDIEIPEVIIGEPKKKKKIEIQVKTIGKTKYTKHGSNPEI